MKTAKDVVLEMCGLAEDDEAGLARLTQLVRICKSLHMLYGCLGDELGSYSREKDRQTFESNAAKGIDELYTYKYALFINQLMFEYVCTLRNLLDGPVPAAEVVAAAGGAAKVYHDAIQWYLDHDDQGVVCNRDEWPQPPCCSKMYGS